MKKIGLLILFAFILSVKMNAQYTFKGVVIDSASKNELSSVRIENAELKVGQSSSSDGKFSIQGRLGDHIIFSRVGHRNKVVVLNEENTNSDQFITLSVKPYQLKPVIIRKELTKYQIDSARRASTYEDVINYKQVKSAMSPISTVYQQFSKKHKDLRKFQAQVLNMEEQKFIDTRYTPELVSSLIKQPVDSVIIFMNSYPMEYDFARAASDLEIKMWIKYNYQEFTNSKPKKKVK